MNDPICCHGDCHQGKSCPLNRRPQASPKARDYLKALRVACDAFRRELRSCVARRTERAARHAEPNPF
jgi:hypothetical protein